LQSFDLEYNNIPAWEYKYSLLFKLPLLFNTIFSISSHAPLPPHHPSFFIGSNMLLLCTLSVCVDDGDHIIKKKFAIPTHIKTTVTTSRWGLEQSLFQRCRSELINIIIWISRNVCGGRCRPPPPPFPFKNITGVNNLPCPFYPKIIVWKIINRHCFLFSVNYNLKYTHVLLDLVGWPKNYVVEINLDKITLLRTALWFANLLTFSFI